MVGDIIVLGIIVWTLMAVLEIPPFSGQKDRFLRFVSKKTFLIIGFTVFALTLFKFLAQVFKIYP